MQRDSLYERMNGLPQKTREEMEMESRKYLESVDHREFLPNSMIKKAKSTRNKRGSLFININKETPVFMGGS